MTLNYIMSLKYMTPDYTLPHAGDMSYMPSLSQIKPTRVFQRDFVNISAN